MNEYEQILWILTYAAATVAREMDPSSKAHNAVIQFRHAETELDDTPPDPFPPEYDPDGDVPF